MAYRHRSREAAQRLADGLSDWDIVRMLRETEQSALDHGLGALAELYRSESAPFTADGGPAPKTWTEADGAPVRTRAGLLRHFGRVERLPGAE